MAAGVGATAAVWVSCAAGVFAGASDCPQPLSTSPRAVIAAVAMRMSSSFLSIIVTIAFDFGPRQS